MADFRGPRMDLDRTPAAFDGESVVGTYRSFATRLTVPGGARVDAAAVSAVSVRPTHRRRGILTEMIERDIRESAARGEVASVLIAAEWPIYGRFGYGPATWQANSRLPTTSVFTTLPAIRTEKISPSP